MAFQEDIDAQPASLVEVLNVDGATGERGDQVDLGFEQQVILPARNRVWFLLISKTTSPAWIPGAWSLLARNSTLVPLDAAVDMNMENLARLWSSFHCTLAAVLLLDAFHLSVAVRADGLEALYHGAHFAASLFSFRDRRIPQRRTAPSLPPRPSHFGHMMDRCRAISEILPL